MGDFVEPDLDGGGKPFTCPYCGSNSLPKRFDLHVIPDDPSFNGDGYSTSKCPTCDEHTIWRGEEPLHPGPRLAPFQEDVLPDTIRDDYLMARVAYAAPPAACALLRGVVHSICELAGATGSNLSDAMAQLAARHRISTETRTLFLGACAPGGKSLPPYVIVPSDTRKVANELFALIAALLRDTGIAGSTTQPSIVNPKPGNVSS